jgi:hypothetical protein
MGLRNITWAASLINHVCSHIIAFPYFAGLSTDPQQNHPDQKQKAIPQRLPDFIMLLNSILSNAHNARPAIT